ncbi:MAG: serine--tRNA ligase [candidate division WOR-3 bacterium]|nr:MAG: serine--tRNA ligase [candidate division WOR-3 bacterium]
MNLKFLRDNPEQARRILELRKCAFDLDGLLELDERRRSLSTERDELRHRQKQMSAQVAKAKQEGQDAAGLMDQAKELSAKVKELDAKVSEVEQAQEERARMLPNIVHESVNEEDVVVSEWGQKPEFGFKPLAHWDLGEALDILDFKASAQLAGSRFTVFKGAGALLRRAMLAYFLDLHTKEHGYTEVGLPVLANRESMEGAGQLPHMEGENYAMRDDPLYLIPTSETPLANLHRGQTLEASDLPKKYVAYTLCFRREAGSYGKDVRGMIRVHQFDKVELFRYVEPDKSYDALEEMLKEAEAAVKGLGIPYRVKRLAAWDIAYQSAKTYDIDAWAAGVGRWLEISSVSNCEDYQMRRNRTRLRLAGGKTGYPHALNGSGLALQRTFVALIENNQQEDGSVLIPEVLRPYMNGLERIS